MGHRACQEVSLGDSRRCRVAVAGIACGLHGTVVSNIHVSKLYVVRAKQGQQQARQGSKERGREGGRERDERARERERERA